MIYALRLWDRDGNTWVEDESTDESYIQSLSKNMMAFDFISWVQIERRDGTISDIENKWYGINHWY